jgi:alpha-L-fucosidase 2
MRGAALFFVDSMVKDPKTGMLITGPSNSPEQGGLVMGPTMDRQIVRTLFGEVAAAAKVLDTDGALRDQLTEMRKQIASNQVGRHGQLQEWMEDTDDPQNQHRHVSHLWGVHPGPEITRTVRRTCSRRRGNRCSTAATRPRAGRWGGRSTCGRGSSTATTHTRFCRT